MKKNICYALISIVLVTLACGTSNIAPTLDPNAIQTAINGTALAAQNQTQAALPTDNPLPTNTSLPPLTPTATLLPIINTPDIQSSNNCDAGDQASYIYHPERLAVLADCIHVSGIIEEIRNEADGDLHMLLKLDPEYNTLLTPANSNELGDLVIEPVCVKTPTQADAILPCSTDPDPLQILPVAGDRVWMEGRYVTDTEHGGWAEIHPLARWGYYGKEAVIQPPPIILSNTLVANPTSSNNPNSNGSYDNNGDGKVTCADFQTQTAAQQAYNAGYTNLDGNDKDGKACESLP